jgi:hypothetical protein
VSEARAKKKPVVFAEFGGQLYVKVAAVMHPLIPFTDGLSVAQFQGDKNLYLKVEDAIEWCRKESRHHSAEKYRIMVEVMERALAAEAAR